MGDPLTPDAAAKKIVKELLSDLSPERQEAVRVAVEDAISEWGNAVSNCESTGPR